MSVIGQAEGIKHGTVRGFRQHIYRKVKPCDDCKAALREERANQREADAAATRKKRKQAPADTPAAPIALPPPPPSVNGDRPHIGVPIAGRDLEIGDVIVHLGRHHPIDRFEPYTGGLKDVLGRGTRVACSGTWGMTVGPESTVRILPRSTGGAQ